MALLIGEEIAPRFRREKRELVPAGVGSLLAYEERSRELFLRQLVRLRNLWWARGDLNPHEVALTGT
jgi:hypothetical protein